MPEPDLPLTDLHRHLEGAIRPQTVLELSLAHRLPLPATDLAGLAGHLSMSEPNPDILQILPRFALMTQVLVNYAVCRRVAVECIKDAEREGLGYVELRFSPLFMAEPHGLDPFSVTAAVCEGWQEASRHSRVKSKLLVILSRTYGPEACMAELSLALAYRERGIAGIDLAGDEAGYPAPLFVAHFQKARDAGLHLTAHAGEFAGSESVRETVLALAPERIGHGVRAVDDPSVMDLLAEKNVAVECCPTSNYYTAAVRTLSEHPLPRFLERGLCATLNTDDPTLFHSITIRDQYRVAQEELGIGPAGLAQLQRNGLRAAFLDETERRALVPDTDL